MPVPLPVPTPPPTLTPPPPFPLFFTGKPAPHHPPNLTPNPFPRDTNRNLHPFAKTTPGKNYPLVSARLVHAFLNQFGYVHQDICIQPGVSTARAKRHLWRPLSDVEPGAAFDPSLGVIIQGPLRGRNIIRSHFKATLSHLDSASKRGFRRCQKGGFRLFCCSQKAPKFLGACAMTTKLLDNKICTFKILLSWRFPRKQAFLDSSPKAPPLKSENFIFIVVSRSLNYVAQPSCFNALIGIRSKAAQNHISVCPRLQGWLFQAGPPAGWTNISWHYQDRAMCVCVAPLFSCSHCYCWRRKYYKLNSPDNFCVTEVITQITLVPQEMFWCNWLATVRLNYTQERPLHYTN